MNRNELNIAAETIIPKVDAIITSTSEKPFREYIRCFRDLFRQRSIVVIIEPFL